jgi:hypothetical protein
MIFWPALPPRPQPHCTWQSSIGISTLAFEGVSSLGPLGFFERHLILMYLMMVNHMDNGDFMDLFHEKQ